MELGLKAAGWSVEAPSDDAALVENVELTDWETRVLAALGR